MFAFLYHPEINPVIIQLWGPLAIRWYSLMYIIAFAIVYLFLVWLIRKGRIRMTKDTLSNLMFVGMIGIILGARLGYVLFYNLGEYIKEPLRIFAVWEGGMSFHGGLIFTLLVIWIYIQFVKKENFFDYADVIIVTVPLGQGLFGRLGNFINAELWGKPTAMPWGMIFPAKQSLNQAGETILLPKHYPASDPVAADIIHKTGLFVADPNSVNLPRHPSPLYEMALEGVVLFIVMFLVFRMKKRPRGILISTYILGYGVCRFIVEFFREPDAQLGYLFGGWLTMGMILCIPMILLGLLGIILSLKLNQRNELWVESAN
jgi:phosphatidylglycerol:prolipoprotein diacylglycerol transferase